MEDYKTTFKRAVDLRFLSTTIKLLNGRGIEILASYGRFLLTEPDCISPLPQEGRKARHMTVEERARSILSTYLAAYELSNDSLHLLETSAKSLLAVERDSEAFAQRIDPERPEQPEQKVININQDSGGSSRWRKKQ